MEIKIQLIIDEYKEELAKAVKDIMLISDRVNVFIDTDVKCKKWLGKVANCR